MGLDLVEILMDVEDEFDIAIPDQDAERAFTTVGATVDYLVGRLGRGWASHGGCPSSRAFYQLRREVVARFGIERSAVRPDSRFGEIIPSRKRSHWRQIAKAAGIPQETTWVAELFSDRFPDPKATVRQLLSRIPATPMVRSDGSDADGVFLRVRRIIADHTGIAESGINRSSQYTKDLNLG